MGIQGGDNLGLQRPTIVNKKPGGNRNGQITKGHHIIRYLVSFSGFLGAICLRQEYLHSLGPYL